MNDRDRKVVAIAGPTGAGKSTLAFEVAADHEGEIVNIDSRQFYEGLPITTNKPASGEREQIPHHFISFLKLGEEINVYDFKQKAYEKIKQLLREERLPILVGGSSLYFRAITENYQFPDVEPDHQLREELERKSKDELKAEILEVDPEADLDWNNKVRLIRHLEILRNQGERDEGKTEPPFEVIKMALIPNRDELKRRLEVRAEEKWASGVAEEVEEFLEKHPNETPLHEAIYIPIIKKYLDGAVGEGEAIEEMAREDYRLAKKQITWLQKEPNLKVFETKEGAIKYINKQLIK